MTQNIKTCFQPTLNRCILLICAFLAPSLANAAPGDDVIRRVQAKFQSLTTLSVQFSMNYLGADSTQSTFQGRLFLQGDVEFRMETPAQVVVCDGKSLWSYNPNEKQVFIHDLETGDMPLLTPRQLLFEYPDKYKVQSVKQAKLAGLTCDLMTMTPKDPSDPTRYLKIWVDRRDNFTRRFQIEDLSDAVTTFDFTGFQTGKSIPDTTFRFTPSAGVEVIDMRKN